MSSIRAWPKLSGLRRPRVLTALLLVLALAAAGCGGDDDSDDNGAVSADSDSVAADDGTQTPDPEPSDSDSVAADDGDSGDSDDDAAEDTDAQSGDDTDMPEEPIVLTASYRGVTPETIKVGISMLDFQFLVENNYSTAGWGDQQGVWQALIDDLNARGGIYGRQLEAVYDFYSPIGSVEAEETCAILTQDNEVFAVLGGFLGPFAGTVDPCIVGTNETMLVGGEITPAEFAQAAAPWYDTNESTDRSTSILLDLLVETGRAEGAKVFLITNLAAEPDTPLVEQALADKGIELVESAVIDAPDADQNAQDAILSVIYERYRASDANTIMLNGNPSAGLRGLQQAGLDGTVPVWANDAPGLENLGESVDRERAQGTITASSASDAELWSDPAMQECVAVTEDALGVTVKDPSDVVVDEENWFNSVRRYCRVLRLFELIATAAGPELTPDAVTAAVAAGELSEFALPGNAHNSLSTDKPYARDEFRLSEYSTAISDGGLAPLTDLIDIFK